MTRTLGPWHVEVDSAYGTCIKYRADGLCSHIARLDDAWICAEHGGSAKANAEHIVRCVNSHEELLAACESALAFLSNHRSEQSIADAALTVIKAIPVFRLLETAIAKATEEIT